MKTFGRKPQNVENKMFYDKDEMKKLSAAVKKVWDDKNNTGLYCTFSFVWRSDKWSYGILYFAKT